MLMKKIGFLVVVAIFSICALGTLAGCISTAKKDQGTGSSETGLSLAFSDFEDVPLPSKVSLNKSKTLIYSAGKGKVGLLTLEGRADPDFLAAFFQNNLPRYGWKPMTFLKDRGYALVFIKDERMCMITISEGWFTSVCEVRVSMLEKAPETGKSSPTQ